MNEYEILSSLFAWGILIFMLIDNAKCKRKLKNKIKDTNKREIQKVKKEIEKYKKSVEKYNDLLEKNNKDLEEKLNELNTIMKGE